MEVKEQKSQTNAQPANLRAEQEATMNNRVLLTGVVKGDPIPGSELMGEGFSQLVLSVQRLSSLQDNIPITLSDELIKKHDIKDGKEITIKGQYRSFNKLINGRSKLMLTVVGKEILDTSPIDNPNIIELSGYICKAPIYRTTPFNREIADVLIAVNRVFAKSDYIPSIAWGRNARAVQNMQVGEKLNLSGRIQSREYQKRLDDGSTETRQAYEVSINQLSKEPLPSAFETIDPAFLADDEVLGALGIG